MEQGQEADGGGNMTQWVYGKNVVKQILKSQTKVHHLYMAISDKEIEELARHKKVNIEHIDKNKLNKMANGVNHQGVAVEIEEYQTLSLKELLGRIPAGRDGWLIMLDELEDPHNLGAILRTCDAVGVDGVIIKKDHAVGLTPTVAKVSAGAIDTIPVASVTNLNNAIRELKDAGYWIVGTDMDRAIDYRQLRVDMPLVLVIGNEGKGISRLVKENCDIMVKLPMEGSISSLNASVAAGVLMYEVHNKKNPL